MKKICATCKAEKPFKEYTKSVRAPDGLQYNCILCQRAKSKAHYEANKATYISRAKARKKTIHSWLNELKSTTPCKDCGVLYPSYVMDFDHMAARCSTLVMVREPVPRPILRKKSRSVNWSAPIVIESGPIIEELGIETQRAPYFIHREFLNYFIKEKNHSPYFSNSILNFYYLAY